MFCLYAGGYVVGGLVQVENYEVLARQVNLKAYNGLLLIVNGKLKKMPSGLTFSNVASVFKLQHLVLMLKLNGSTIHVTCGLRVSL